MPSWIDLNAQLEQLPGPARLSRLQSLLGDALARMSRSCDGRNVIFYASSFLQKPGIAASYTQITHEDLNGFMSVMHGMDWSKGLTLVLHTPGGVTNAAETIVSYLSDKFETIEAVIPTYAMSAGTMITLACDSVVMGRQSQLGPIDPQLPVGGGRFVSARAIVDQFAIAKADILANREAAHFWAPILPSLGPALLQEARNALEYGEEMVARWLQLRMFKERENPKSAAERVARHFNDASSHKSHGRRIDRREAEAHGIRVRALEADQDFQDAVLTAYHLVTILFEKSQATKVLVNGSMKMWVKNLPAQAAPAGQGAVRRAP